MANSINGRLPEECSNIAEVRGEIDNIDREIIRLIGVRFDYVREVVKYKTATASGVEASGRRQEVLDTRRQWAQENGLDPDVVEDIYVRLVQYFIDEEKKILKISPLTPNWGN